MSLPEKLWIPNTHYHPIGLLDHGALEDVTEIIVHINDGTTNGTLAWWARAGHEADGAHLQISKNGQAYQTLALNREAWHCPPVNRTSVGIEHEGYSKAEPKHVHDSRPHVQLHASANRAAWICHECKLGRPKLRGNIFPHGFYPEGGHSNCPGPWDWEMYMEMCMAAYMSHWGR